MGSEPIAKGHGVNWVCEAHEERPVRLTGEGLFALPPVTVMNKFKQRIEKTPEKNAINVKRNGVWKTWTWKQYYDDVLQFAKALLSLDFKAHQCVSILGFNAPEWYIADIGAIAAGGIAAGIYTTNGPEACRYIIEHSESVVVVVEDEAQLRKILAVRSALPHVKALVQWSGEVKEEGVYSWEAFMRLGDGVTDAVLNERIGVQKPEQCGTLIYTSGTTGQPKAVMLSQDNLTWTAASLADSLKATEANYECSVSYLPLSHIAAQISDIHLPMAICAAMYFAQPDALKGTLGATLKEVRPTLFLGVPRVWEKIHEKMKEIGAQNSNTKKKISAWARGIGLKGGYAQQQGESKPRGWRVANKLVFGKVRDALGLDRARINVTSAAPISKETLDFFLSLNIPLTEVYGMSESTGPQTGTFPPFMRTGSAGKALGGTEMKIDRPDAEGNGEICWRGRNVFMGYMKNPQATSETIDEDGFLHSGDIGRIDADGFLFITGRIKELIITAGGENIPPVLIEDDLKKELGSVISNAMVIGDRRKFLACLFTLKAKPVAELVEGQYPFTDQLHPDAQRILAENGATVATVAEAQNNPQVMAFLEKGVSIVNKRATSNAQQIRKCYILPEDFAIENDTFTPTLKLKRRVVVQKYEKEIDKLYEDAEREMAARG